MFILRCLAAVSLCFTLSGCLLTAVVGTAAGVAKIANDERPLGQQFDDSTIALKIDARLIAEKDMPSRWISIDVINGKLTLTGYLPSQAHIDRAIFIGRSITGVQRVDSKLTIGEPTSTTILSDTWITTRVKRLLLNDKTVSGLNIHVETVHGKVYLQGVVQVAMERERAKKITHSVAGVTAVVDLFSTP
ncbi:MAG: BON domain-containing protein [Mariprofundus sp.]|nr:BON domain-containing protein [Mariprofundus sp.]